MLQSILVCYFPPKLQLRIFFSFLHPCAAHPIPRTATIIIIFLICFSFEICKILTCQNSGRFSAIAIAIKSILWRFGYKI